MFLIIKRELITALPNSIYAINIIFQPNLLKANFFADSIVRRLDSRIGF